MSQRYWAFISYSHADEKAATRLHRALEGYTLPAPVRRAHRLPKRLIPVFRDVDELEAAPGLTTRLRGALEESQWLIVLCSANAAQSRYVNAEIEHFVSKHGAEKVLCVLHEGEPPECFPPAVRAFTEEPLAADMRKGADFELALQKLVAAIALISFTGLRNREAQRKRRRRWLAAAGLAIGAMSGVAYWDAYQREFVEDYAHYVRRNGIWTGVDPLSADIAARRHEVYRFVRHGRRNPPATVAFLDSVTGKCPEGGMFLWIPDDRPSRFLKNRNLFCSAVFDYTTDGSLAREQHAGLEQDGWTGELEFDGSSAHTMFSIPPVVVVADRDKAGLDQRLRWYDIGPEHLIMQKALQFDHDAQGRVTRRSVVVYDGSRPWHQEWQETGETTTVAYSPEGLVTEIRQVDLQGKPRLGAEGFSVARLAYDADGNVSATSFFDTAGQPLVLAAKPLLRRLYNE